MVHVKCSPDKTFVCQCSFTSVILLCFLWFCCVTLTQTNNWKFIHKFLSTMRINAFILLLNMPITFVVLNIYAPFQPHQPLCPVGDVDCRSWRLAAEQSKSAVRCPQQWQSEWQLPEHWRPCCPEHTGVPGLHLSPKQDRGSSVEARQVSTVETPGTMKPRWRKKMRRMLMSWWQVERWL